MNDKIDLPHTEMAARLNAATTVIDDAASLALYFFARRDRVEARSKHFQDFVSEADMAVETLVRDRLAKLFPGETVVGEEMGGEGGDSYWIIDPIDGTSNFLRGSPLWGISLGHVTHGVPDIGVVALPDLGRTFAAATRVGILLNGAPFSREVPFADVQVLSLGDSLNDDIADITALQNGLRQKNWVVEAFHSTSIGLAFSACGILDGHLQKTTTMWDIAGGAVLCREAGLDVRIGHTGDVPWIAAGTPALMEAVGPLWPEISAGKS